MNDTRSDSSSKGYFEQNSKAGIIANNLVKTYSGRRVVDEVSLTLNSAEIVGLLGANGAGKTTTFYMLVGLERVDAGRIALGDYEITELPMYLRARLGIGYLPQEASVFRKLTAEQNILAVLETRSISRDERHRKLENLLEEFGLNEVRNVRGESLSGGERRRVEIARCLAAEPKFILLDEPFAGIDPLAIDDIREMILYLKRQGIGILITDHNVRETLGITDRAYILSDGKILREGTPEELVSDPEVRLHYLGERFRL
jgi:lipopolysaccharide export system ATP-binding protein